MEKIRLGNIELISPLILAPMAGVTTPSFRAICHEFGSAYQPTELVSARSILYSGLEKSMCYLRIDKEREGITCIQLFGSEPGDFDHAIKSICEDPRLSFVDIIDINMGCPVPKVVKTGAGSALINDPLRAQMIIEFSRKAADAYGKALTVKTRIGFDEEDKTNGKGEDFIKMLAQSGVDLIAVHGRTRVQMYHGDADIETLARYRSAIKDTHIPFIANGDVKDGESAARILRDTNADGLMIGRAATGNPWVFEEIRCATEGKEWHAPTADDRKKMILRELKDTLDYKDEPIAVREMRPAMMAYIKGLPGAAKLKVRLCSALTIKEVEEILWET